MVGWPRPALGRYSEALAACAEARRREEAARHDAEAWIEDVRDRRQLAQNER